MDRDLLDRFHSFKLLDTEDNGLRFDQSDLQVGKEECERSLIGRIYGDKAVKFTGLRNTLTTIWSSTDSFKIRELGPNLFQFVFTNQHDKNRILNGRTWTFDGHFLILKPWAEDMDFRPANFNKVLLWVQIWNLSPHWLAKATGFKFKHIFNDVLDVHIPDNGSKGGRHIKILTEVDLLKPLLRGTKLRVDDQVVWAEFRYEKMACFYFYCGFVGHTDKACAVRVEGARNGTLQSGQYGDWLRADIMKSPEHGPSARTTRETVVLENAPLLQPVQLDVPNLSTSPSGTAECPISVASP